MLEKWLFVVRVFEGAVTWSEVGELDVDEIDWLFKKADDANARLRGEMDRSKNRGRGRRRGR